jgi:hypothetical protein
MKMDFSRQTFEKYSNINFMHIHLVGSEFFHGDGQTDRQTERHNEANSRFSQFCEST